MRFSDAQDGISLVQSTPVINSIFLKIFADKYCADLGERIDNKLSVFLT